ncbi:MAG: immune inhibitor A [Dehalogenimonas sp.]
MKRRLLSILGLVALLVGLIANVPLTAAPSKIPADLVPVDNDPYYKSQTFDDLKGNNSAKTTLTAAQAQVKNAGVGTIAELFADGAFQTFTLKAIGGNCEIWLANDLSYPENDPRPTPVVTQTQIDYLFDEFNSNIYQKDTQYFGYTLDRNGYGTYEDDGETKDIPAVYQTTNPQRVMILVFNIIDEGYYDPTVPTYIAGYFAPAENENFNRNIIHIDSHDWANRVGADVNRPFLYEGTIAHEYEHAIHYDHDADEPSWTDEGMADLAGYLCDYGHPDDHIAYYMVYHRTPLTTWGGGLESYGASYLFQFYLMENFGGPDFISALVDEPLNGIAGIESQLGLFGYDSNFDDIYRDWTLANYLDKPDMEGESDAVLGYTDLDIPSADSRGYSIQWSIKNYYGSDNHGNLPLPRYWGGYKSGTVQYPIGSVMPYTPMYLTYKGAEPQLISNFRGADTSGVAPKTGSYELFGGRGDLLENTATLANAVSLGANASLSFNSWYQIEEFWDFGFVQISTDNGVTWTSLSNENTTSTADPEAIQIAVDNLPGFTGASDDWTQQVFDLSAYAGQSVKLRFLYITDWATNEAGFYVDDVLVTDNSGTVFDDGLETSGDNWVFDGWTRTTGLVTNDWLLTFINPVYQNGKFVSFTISDEDPVKSGNYQVDTTSISTVNLGKDEVTIIVSNFLPESSSFNADYRLLVQTGNNKVK